MQFDLVEWKSHFTFFEGRVNHFYLDGSDNVTIGIGHLILDPTTVNMVRKQDDLLANRSDLFTEYNGIKAMPQGRGAAYYDKICRLYMTEFEIDRLFLADITIHSKLVELSFKIPEGMPAIVLVDMAYTLGCEGLKRKFSKFVNLFEAGDAHGASQECVRIDVQKERNEWARAVLEACKW